MEFDEKIPYTNWSGYPVADPNHPDKDPDILSTNGYGNTGTQLFVWFVAGLATNLVLLRLYYHIFRNKRRLWCDDYFLLLALLCLEGNAIAIRLWAPYKYEPNTSEPQTRIIMIFTFMGLFNSLAMGFSKTSLAITFMRLTSGWWKFSLGFMMVIIDILLFIQGWTFWIQDCHPSPPEKYRIHPTGHDGCLLDAVMDLRMTIQVFSCLFDAYLTFLPWKIVRPLDLSRYEKIGLSLAMSFGAASLACGILRLVSLHTLDTLPYYDRVIYQPFYYVGGYMFNFLEPAFSIIAGCMPILRKVMKDLIEWKINIAVFKRLFRRKRRGIDTDTTMTASGLPFVNVTNNRPSGSSKDDTITNRGSSSERTDTTLVATISPPLPPPPPPPVAEQSRMIMRW